MTRHMKIPKTVLTLIVMAVGAGLAAAQISTPRIEADFALKKKQLSKGKLFEIFKYPMSEAERQSMTFLYAYMTVGDITDYSGEFYLSSVKASLRTRESMPWGSLIPDDVWRHFVLPVRVNNENLDNARIELGRILAPRVKGLTMEQAALEVNHWCHEKVTYEPSDARTSAPLSTVRSAIGRCGEESTLLVSALRSVGIPARQVYTPRWAHTDDNHAWVEVWVDGRWHFLGACEPEPVLDLGWFNAPASRGLLMHTKVPGYYEGPEEVMRRTANFTEINVIDNYAASARSEVYVVDENGVAVEGACVEFGIYNYAEFYTVSRQTTDAAGRASLTAGLGDMMVYASKNDRFGLKKISFGIDAQVVLDHAVGEPLSMDVDITVPRENPVVPAVSAEQRAENTVRLQKEDSIRNAYVATFADRVASDKLTQMVHLDADSVWKVIGRTRGNYGNISNFLIGASGRGMAQRALQLLGTLSHKDLRDADPNVLNDHLYNTPVSANVATVLAPRIANEQLTAYRSFFGRVVNEKLRSRFTGNPETLVQWCRKNIVVRNDLSTLFTTISPEGVWRARVADERSLSIFFVAMARSLGISSYIDEVTGNTMYIAGADTVRVDLSGSASVASKPQMATLRLDFSPSGRLSNPEYYRHFSIARYSDGRFSQLTYPDFEPWSTSFAKGTTVEQGYYMLTSGTRLATGNVLAHIEMFPVSEGSNASKLILRNDSQQVSVIGSLDSESVFTGGIDGQPTSLLKACGRGYFVLGIVGVGQEPSIHALNDIALQASQLKASGRTMVLLFPSRTAFESYMLHPVAGLPDNVVMGIDDNQAIERQLRQSMEISDEATLPIFVIADTFNRVVFETHGYTIGLGNTIVKTLNAISQ